MFTASVLVRNIESHPQTIDFGEFIVQLVGPRYAEFRERFSSMDVNPNDWILEKSYTILPPGPPGSSVGGIPNDIEDVLLLLRLFKIGDVAFVKQAITLPSGERHGQLPYRAMNDLNSYSSLPFHVGLEEVASWKGFANDIRKSQSWGSDWFAIARRFFLSGGAKQWNPRWDDVDRVVDYATALEATLVPEPDFNSRRIRQRAAALLAPDNPTENDVVRRLVQKLYDARSTVVHGTRLSQDRLLWLSQNWPDIEARVRQILVQAVHKLPPGEEHRRGALAALYDPSDRDRANSAFDRFKEIKDAEIRRETSAKIAQLVASS